MSSSARKSSLSASPRAVWRLAWPQIAMMYLLFFTGLTTIWVAGRISGEVQAALGMVTQCGIFLMVVIMSVSSGATAAITQSLGMGKTERARLYIYTAVAGSLVLGAIMAVPALIFGEPLLRFLKVPEEILPVARRVWNAAMLGLPLQYVYSCTGVMFRATRLVLPPLWVSAIICVFNFVFALGFGLGQFGFRDYGYMGLIWVNVASTSLGAVLNCALLIRSGYLRLRRPPAPAWLKRAVPYLIKVALPAGAAQIVWQSGYLTLFVLVASLPRDSVSALAGLTAGLRAEALIFMPGMAFNMTCSILVGNSLGQGKPEKAKSLGLRLTLIAAAAMSVVAALIWPFREEIAVFLSQEEDVRAQIVSYLSYNLISTPFTIASQAMGGIMVGAGATVYNLVVYGGSFWCVRLPLGWLLGHVLWQSSSGVFAAMVASQVVQTVIMLYVVLRRDWQRFAMPQIRAARRQPAAARPN